MRALSADRAWGRRFIAAGAPLSMREIAGALKARLGDRAAGVSARQAPDLLVRTMGLVSHQALLLAPDLGKRRSYDAARPRRFLAAPCVR